MSDSKPDAHNINSGALVFDPTAPSRTETRPIAHSLDTLSGKVVGFIDNAKPNFNYLVDDVAERLIARYGVASVVKRCKGGTLPVPPKMLEELSGQCDAIITGAGD